MYRIWFEYVNLSIIYGHLEHMKTQTILDKLCWKMPKTWNYNRNIYRISVTTPIPPSMLENGKCKLVWDESVLSTLHRGGERQNVYRMIFFQPLWPRLWLVIKLLLKRVQKQLIKFSYHLRLTWRQAARLTCFKKNALQCSYKKLSLDREITRTQKCLKCLRPFALSGHMVRNKLCWDSINSVGLAKQSRAGLERVVPLRYLCPSIIYWWPDRAKGLLATE